MKYLFFLQRSIFINSLQYHIRGIKVTLKLVRLFHFFYKNKSKKTSKNVSKIW